MEMTRVQIEVHGDEPPFRKGLVRVSYRLSSAGQRAALLAGADANADQVLWAAPSDELLRLATVKSNGDAVLDVHSIKFRPRETCPWGPCVSYFDAPQTVPQLIAAIEVGRVAAEEAADREQREATDKRRRSLENRDWDKEPGPAELPAQSVCVKIWGRSGLFDSVRLEIPRGIYERRGHRVHLIRLLTNESEAQK